MSFSESIARAQAEGQAFTKRTPRIVAAAKLHRAAARRKAGRFLVEGFNSVDAAIRADAAVEIFVTARAADEFEPLLAPAAESGFSISLIDDSAAASLAETVTTTGLFAVCETSRVHHELDTVLAAGKRTGVLAVLFDCQDPGNLGTVIRMVDALGLGGVILAGDSVDPLSGKASRSSAGSVFHVPFVRERDAGEVLASLSGQGFTTLATTMDGHAVLGRDALPEGPVAWLFGNEAHGLEESVIAGAGRTVSIPIRGEAESLNLATAAAMCLWESARGK
nr:RNA methyltransferase [Corynebacterium lactis]